MGENMNEHVVLVNENDEATGVMEKMEAHRSGSLHRAFSVFIFDKKGRMLLQQRAAGKYHGAGLWTNACCSHPRPEEAVEEAAVRRLKEEMGFSCRLHEIFSFTYRAEVENGLVEHEYDHVFAGEYEAGIYPNAQEVAGHAYYEMEKLEKMIAETPEKFTTWFRIAFPQVENWWQSNYRVGISKDRAGAE